MGIRRSRLSLVSIQFKFIPVHYTPFQSILTIYSNLRLETVADKIMILQLWLWINWLNDSMDIFIERSKHWKAPQHFFIFSPCVGLVNLYTHMQSKLRHICETFYITIFLYSMCLKHSAHQRYRLRYVDRNNFCFEN